MKLESRSTRSLLGAALAALTLGLVALTGTAAVVGQSSPGPIYQPPQSYYLALGDSMAYGFQPTKANAPPSTGQHRLRRPLCRASAEALSEHPGRQLRMSR